MESKKQPSTDAKAIAVPAAQESILQPAVQASSAKSEEKALLEKINLKRPTLLWVIALLLGWAFDFLFWKQSIGLNFALFLALSLLIGFLLLYLEEYKPSRTSLWLLLPFGFFVVMTFVRQEPLTMFLAYAFTLFLLGLFTTSYLGGHWPLYRLSDYFYKFVLLIGDMIFRPFGFFRQTQRTASESGVERKSLPIAGILRGLLIALPILLCFGSLLASADVVFSQKLTDFFDTEKLSEYMRRIFLIVLLAYLLAGIFLHAAIRSNDEKITHDDKPIIKPFLGFTESAVVLGSVSILFLMFVVVQFQYFFGGETNIGVQGYTYSQYARRGFNELVVVAFFSLVMILGLSTITRRENDVQKKVYSGLSVGVVGLVMVILVSAYQRISLAIDWHGFSRLRLYPRIFLIWLGILLVAVVILEIYRRERYFAFAAVLASLGFAISLSLVNVDGAIVKHNIPRVLQGKNLNVAHLSSLSVDAVPALVDEYFSMPESAREGVGAILACYRYSESRPHISEENWRSFNFSKWQAHQALSKIRPYLAGYIIKYDRWPERVRTPSGALCDCMYTGRAQEE